MKARSVRLCLVVALYGALGGSLSGCLVGPNYHRPPVPVPQRYKELQGWTAAAPAAAAPKGEWWTAFHDPLIDQLEPQVAVSNQTVRQDYANYQEALAEVKVARSQLFPTLGVTGSISRSGGAAQTGAPAAGSGAGGGSAVLNAASDS